VLGSDTRLTDARTPLSHSHAESDVTNLTSDLAGKQPLLGYTPQPADVSRNGLVAEYRFNEGSGSRVVNYATPFGAPVNLYPAAESLSGVGSTLRYAAPPFGTGMASRWNQNGFQVLGGNVALPAGTYTVSIWVASNTGVAQTVRQQLNNVNSSNKTVPATGWVRLTMTGTVTAGSIGVYPLYTDSTNDPNDVLYYGAQLEKGTNASDYVPALGHALALGTATWSSSGLTTTGGTRASFSGRGVSTSSVYVVCKWPVATNAADNTTVALFTADDTSSGHPFYLYAGNGSIRPGFNYQAIGLTAATANLHDGNWHMVAGIYDGTNLRVFIDDLELATSNPSARDNFVANIFNVGSLTNSWVFPGEIAYASFYNVGHTPAQVRTQYSALKGLLSTRLTLTQPDVVFFEGDSITEGASLTTPWPLGAMNALSTIKQGKNNAVSGSVITASMGTSLGVGSLEARAAALDLNASASRPRNVLVVLAGYNALNGGAQSAAAMVADLKAYCLARRAAGWNRIIVGTLTPATTAGINAKRNAANALIRADTSFYDGLADFAADSTIGTDAAASNTTYYSDGVHPTQAGANIMATIAAAVIQAQL
jgi:lysophospholipase L1-like esterase